MTRRKVTDRYYLLLVGLSIFKLGQTRFLLSLVHNMLLLFVSVFAITMNPV